MQLSPRPSGVERVAEDELLPVPDSKLDLKGDARTERKRVSPHARAIERMYCPCAGFAYNTLSGDRNLFVSSRTQSDSVVSTYLILSLMMGCLIIPVQTSISCPYRSQARKGSENKCSASRGCGSVRNKLP